MVEAADRQRLFDWLRGRGADDTFLSYLAAELGGSGAADALAFGRPERDLVVEGLLFLACEPRVDERRLDALVAVATRLGFDEDALAGLIQERLGVTERRLRAYAVLKLSLDATQDEIKATQRRIAKVLHPDRLTEETPEARERAEKLLGRVNHARAVLQSTDEITLYGDDDVGLDDPSWTYEDAPTEVTSFADVSHLLEEWR